MAPKDKVKEVLFNDKNKLIYLLEELGCHKINQHYSKDEIRCALPDGDRATSVSVMTDTPHIGCQVFSRSEYEDFEIKDIFSLIQFIRGISFTRAIEWACSKLGVECEDYEPVQTLGVVQELRQERRRKSRGEYETVHEILDERILDQYSPIVVENWVEEGISAEVQQKYGIRNDEIGKRWLIPIYDEFGNLISLKGRTYAPNWEIMGINKFIYYYKLGVNDILFGLNYNRQSIIEHDEIILFEAEKSVMAADSYGYDWSTALGKNGINPHIRRKILSLHVSNCVLAFDNDVPYKTQMKEAMKLSKYMNVYLMRSSGILQDKQSPTDPGKAIFEELYRNRIKVR